MNSLIEALAKALNVSVDGVPELLGNIKDSTPQLYEQLISEWTYWTVLDKSSGAMLIVTGILMAYTLILRYNLEVDIDIIDSNRVPEGFTRYQYGKYLTQKNVSKASKTFGWLFTGIIITIILSMVLNISKNVLAPNYSFLLDEVLPKLINK
jgi:hypothetical protein